MVAASQFMAKDGIRHLPVMNEKGVLVGMISDRDVKLASSVVADGTHINAHKKVTEFMTSPVQKVNASDDLKGVIRQMLEQKVSCYIVEENSQAVGIVTTDDFLIHLLDLLDRGENFQGLKKLFRF